MYRGRSFAELGQGVPGARDFRAPTAPKLPIFPQMPHELRAPFAPQAPAVSQSPIGVDSQGAIQAERMQRFMETLERQRRHALRITLEMPRPSGAEMIARGTKTTGSLIHGNPQ